MHFYKHPLHGKLVPSPTTIIGQLDKSGPLTHWAAGCTCEYVFQALKDSENISFQRLAGVLEEARKNFLNVSKTAMGIGASVHEAISYYLKTKTEPRIEHDNILAGFVSFLEWKDKVKLEVLGTEQVVYDPAGRYAGTLDLICKINNKLYIIDFKTTKKPHKPYEEWSYQLAAYANCVDVEGIGILRLDKDTGYPDWYDLSHERERAFRIFQCLLELWYLRNPSYPK